MTWFYLLLWKIKPWQFIIYYFYLFKQIHVLTYIFTYKAQWYSNSDILYKIWRIWCSWPNEKRFNADMHKNKNIKLLHFLPYDDCLTRKYFSPKNEILEIRRNSVIESSHVSFVSLLSFPFIQKCNRKQNYVLSSKLRE